MVVSGLVQNPVMRSDPSQEDMIPMEFEGEAIEEIDTAFPPILAGLHFLDSK